LWAKTFCAIRGLFVATVGRSSPVRLREALVLERRDFGVEQRKAPRPPRGLIGGQDTS
jgi:hypothetical protein